MRNDEWKSATSRRRFLKSAAAIAAVGGARRMNAGAANGPILAYVGSYSSPQGAEGAKGNGPGIYLFEMDRGTGELKQREVFEDGSNPSWLDLNPAKTHLYVANETATFRGATSGSVTAFAIDRPSGRLTAVNEVSSEGAGPAHLSVHPSGKHVLVANYAGGTVAVLPVRADGGLGAATDVKHDEGAVGPANAASAPKGSFAMSGHDRTHAHMIQSDPSGRFVLSSDLGMDRILVWKFDAGAGKLSPNDPPSVSVPPGDGPRHFVFHPNGRWLYSLQEEGSTLMLFDYDAAKGRLAERQKISSLPKGFAGTNFTSEVRVSADGRFVYAANRLHDSIGVFKVGAEGKLTFAGETWTRGDYPRSFTIDPSGNFLYSCNQRADAITTFRVDKKTGALAFTGRYTPVGTPANVVFLA